MYRIKCTTEIFAFTILAALIFAAATSTIYAQNEKRSRTNNSLWQKTDESSVQSRGERSITPEKFVVFRLNRTLLKTAIAELPLEKTDAANDKPVVMEMPMPDGTIQRFRMEETKVLSDELAAQYPDWKTFVGYNVENPTLTGRFDWNVLGFHGYISTAKGTVVIDPYQKGDTENYMVYYKQDFGGSGSEFYCKVEETMAKIIDLDSSHNFTPLAPTFSFGSTIKTFRIAIATTGEWSRNAAGFNGTQNEQQIRDAALAQVVTTVNRLNGIYERELASRFQLVNPPTNDNNANIIFDNPATDPYNNTDQAKDDAAAGTVDQLRINRETINTRRGETNYDIGHLFGTGGGGIASTPSLCESDKAQGYSARNNQLGDPFVVDYVAHEIGHQFGSDHTYNNIDIPNTGACPQSSYSAENAFEPGSGSTIMSYVGICGARNLQQNVDFAIPAFHIRSLTVISTNMATPTVQGCGTTSGTNTVPTVSAGNSFTIPKLTPFTLTATGNDADASDVANLLYSWEEYDKAQKPSGPAGDPAGVFDIDTDGVLRPLFRVYSPIAGSSRTFPSLVFILNPDANNDPSADVNGVRGNQPKLTYTGTHPTGAPGAVCDPSFAPDNPCVIGERLPTVARTMNFRVAVRDRRGGVADAGTSVVIDAASGPFQVTTQNSAAAAFAPEVTWQAGSSQTVTWDVANTNVAPVNTTNVNILLSTDGGLTFPTVILANTPNDGSEQITVPNAPTTMARIKVEAVGNIYFDINNANFTITAPTAASVSISGRVLSQRGKGISRATVKMMDQNGNVSVARTNRSGYYYFADVAAGETYIFTISAKGYQFSDQVVPINENLEELNFRAQ